MAQLGNQYGIILKDSEIRQEAYRDLCAHLAEGYPLKAWSFRKGEFRCCWATMISYIKGNPQEFDPFLKNEAHSQAYKKWFGKGINLSDGKVKGNPSPQTWATIMRNMFDWDKESKAMDQAPKEFDQQLDIIKKPTSPEK